MTAARKEASRNVKTGKTGENGKNSKNKDLGTNLVQISYIQYPITFQKQSVSILFDSENEVNAIYLTFAKKLGLSIRLTDIRV